MAEGASGWRWVNLPAIGLILAYRVCLAPLLGGQCRFRPTCSAYALEAYRSRDPVRASWLVAWRLLRCHPWGGSGEDPVPPIGKRRGTAGISRTSDGEPD